MKRLLTILTAIMLFQGIARAQQFPVQVTPQLLPPYSVQVSDYYSPGAAGTKLNLLLLLRDFNKPQLQVRLRMSIEGQSVSLRTREDAVFTPITIESGTPTYVDPSELAQYFNPDNLDFSGITRQQYMQTGKLPEGFYTFCFEAIETTTNQSVSNKGCTFAWMTLNEPPILNLPRKAEGVIPADPQNIIFQWTPRHTASPTAAFVTDYIFSIVEMNDNVVAPEAAFLSNAPLHVDSVTTTTYLYDATKPALISGKKYAWRIQAKAKNGTQDLATFRNQGYSETFWFTYQNNCAIPTGATATPQGQRVTIEWNPNPVHLEYKVEYREANNADAIWFEIGNTLPRVSITDLKPGTLYEYRVGGACEYGRFTFGNLLPFTTNGESATTVPECGIDPNLTDPPQNLLQTFPVGDTIRAGDYDVIVTSITGQTSFSGEGYTKISWLGNAIVAVRFTNIGINTDKKLAIGQIETTYDPTAGGIADIDEYINAYIPGNDVGSVKTGLDTTKYSVDVSISTIQNISVVVNADGTANLTIAGDDASVINLSVSDLPTTLKDKDGRIYEIGKNGDVTYIGKKNAISNLDPVTLSKLRNDKATVTFINNPDATKQKYAFDEWRQEYSSSSTFEKEYEKLADGYFVPTKAIVEGKSDIITAQLNIVDNATIKIDSIKFTNRQGTQFASTYIGSNKFEIKVVGGPAGDAQEIFAIHPDGNDKQLLLGKLLLASYPEKKLNLVLVPVNGVTVDRDSMIAALRVYESLGVTFNVTVAQSFQNTEWDNGDGKMDVGNTGIFESYTDEMKQLISLYKINNSGYDKNAIHLFVLPQASIGNSEGEMPRAKQFGFLFRQSGAKLYRTAAHEIGHGAFKLRHTFDGYGFSQNELLDNLMSYGSGLALTKFQWDALHDPAITFGIFDTDPDAKSVIILKRLPEKFCNSGKDKTYTFVTPAGTYITLPNYTTGTVFWYGIPNGKSVRIPTGSLTGFTLIPRQGTKYNYKAKFTEDGKFAGYYSNDVALDAKYIKSDYRDSAIMGYPYHDRFVIHKWKASLTPYTTNATDVLLEKDFTLIPFANNELPGVKLEFTDKEYQGILGSEQESINANYISMVSEYEAKPELLSMLKIIQLKTIYPAIFESFTEDFDNWEGVHRSIVFWDKKMTENPDLKLEWKNEPVKFYNRFIDSLLVFINTKALGKFSVLDNLNTQTTALALLPALEAFSDNEIRDNFTLTKRLLSISICAAYPEMFDESFERQIIRLIKYTPDNQANGLLDGLLQNNLVLTEKKLLNQLISNIDDSFIGFGEDNYKELIKAFINVANRSSVFQDKRKLINNENFYDYYVNFNYESIWSRAWNYASKTSYILTNASLASNGTVTIKNNFLIGGIISAELYNKPFGPFDPVWLSNQSSLTMLRDVSDKTGAFVPAIVVKYCDDKGDMKTSGDAIEAAIDAIGLVSGYTEIKAGVTGIRRAMVITDLVGSSVSLADNISGGQLRANFPAAAAVLDALTILNAGLGITTTTGITRFSGAESDLHSYYNSSKTVGNGVDEMADLASVKEAEDFLEKVVIAGNVGELGKLTTQDQAKVRAMVKRLKTEGEVFEKKHLLENAIDAEKELNKINGIVEKVSKYPVEGFRAVAEEWTGELKDRFEQADAFYRRFKPSSTASDISKIDDELRGIDFDYNINEGSLKTDDIIYSWVYPDEAGNFVSNRVGQYFTKDPTVTPDKLGIPMSYVDEATGKVYNRVLRKFKVQSPMAYLESTASDIIWRNQTEVYTGGGKQFFIHEAKSMTNLVLLP